MKKFLCVFLILVTLLSLTACGKEPSVPNSFVEDREERFIFVDEWKESLDTGSKQNMLVIADKETYVMYLVVYDGYRMCITPLLCEDGSPIVYTDSKVATLS